MVDLGKAEESEKNFLEVVWGEGREVGWRRRRRRRRGAVVIVHGPR